MLEILRGFTTRFSRRIFNNSRGRPAKNGSEETTRKILNISNVEQQKQPRCGQLRFEVKSCQNKLQIVNPKVAAAAVSNGYLYFIVTSILGLFV